MNIYSKLEDYNLNKECVVGVGCFDAMHLGHIELIKKVKEIKDKMDVPAIIFSIENYKHDKNITSQVEKINILKKYDIDAIIFQEFNAEFKSISATSFIDNILIKNLNAKYVVVGEDFKFGKDGLGNVKSLMESTLNTIPINLLLDNENEVISSSKIHDLLINGDLAKANELLGREYNFYGKVDFGKKLASQMGFPTANIYPDTSKLSLPFGVYATKTIFDGKEYVSISNIGLNPTMDKDMKIKLETHIVGLDEDIYQKEIDVLFIEKIRDEKKFENIENLFNQIKKDLFFRLNMCKIKS